MKKTLLKALKLSKKILSPIKQKIKASLLDFEIDIPVIVSKEKKLLDKKIVHIAAFTYGNAGDAILPTTVRNAVENQNEQYNWTGVHAHTVVTDSMVNSFNATNGIVIGGGGLFLADTNKNDLSGWQWSCSLESLNKIKVPIALFAVGYNRFRGQKDFAPIFKEHVNLLAEKSDFIGLRNYGSIENIKKYIDKKNHHKIRFQPCPTTLISKLYPTVINEIKNSQEKPFIAVNCAFDRSNLRYGEKIGTKLTSVANVLKQLSKTYDIVYYSHCASDNYFLPYLDSFNINYKLLHLNLHPTEIIRAYAKPALTIGMRGHAQMIPFGCGTPILSIISHEKIRYFIEDINHPEWGVDINDADFEDKLLTHSLSILSNREETINKLEIVKEVLYKTTLKNVQFIREKFNL